jgi:DedD protein
MSAERKKLLWIAASACLFVLVLAATGFFLFAPAAGGATAPATLGNTAAPKAADPQDFLMTPPPAPSLEQPRGDGVVVIYGEKPADLKGAATGAAELGAAAKSLGPKGSGAAPKAAEATGVKAAKPPAAQAASAKLPPKKVKVEEFWIQAAAFTSRGRADELKDALAAKGIASLISVKDIDGKSWYRVRVGPYSGKTEAEGWLGRLKGLQGCAEAYVSRSVVERLL